MVSMWKYKKFHHFIIHHLTTLKMKSYSWMAANFFFKKNHRYGVVRLVSKSFLTWFWIDSWHFLRFFSIQLQKILSFIFMLTFWFAISIYTLLNLKKISMKKSLEKFCHESIQNHVRNRFLVSPRKWFLKNRDVFL